jgi:hypothetical protein
VATLLQDLRSAVITTARGGRRVELLAATAILALSVGCGLAASRLAMDALFNVMPRSRRG